MTDVVQTTTTVASAARVGFEPLEHVVLDAGAIIKGVSLTGIAKVAPAQCLWCWAS